MNKVIEKIKNKVSIFIDENQKQIIVFILLITFSSVFRSVPYINIFLINTNFDIYFIGIMVFFLFLRRLKYILIFIIYILILNMIVSIFMLDKISEGIGNYTYFLLIISFFQYIFYKKD